MSIAFLCPGQGSQQPGMLHQLPNHPQVQKTMNDAEDLLKKDVFSLDTEKEFQSTAAVQISLFLWSIAMYRVFQAEGVKPDMAAGHSVGAFSAAVIAESLSFKEALELVRNRGKWMEEAHPSGYGMGVVTGLSYNQIKRLLKKQDPNKTVYLANLNADDQFTISGSEKALDDFLKSASNEGARKAELLDVTVPSHCKLMRAVTEKMRQYLNEISFLPPKIPYAGNAKARAFFDAESIKEDLAESISKPVYWNETVHLYYERGARLFVELSPQAVLSDLVNKTFSEARAISVSNGLENCLLLMERYNWKS
ncbi:ACP S-malonyltransferase [Alteribacillus bidgolensis]|uniref:Malonyl CoA-acyl carrier protein transacylase n=1 Tax=Alteribacillus bidgolensis TaxID=930129 RepID=A0A1G8KH96_9BACI|nr:malonate decarboxylase subunit epsilon [Alteribacillus bidgolensis]SDI42833.1 malonate decarboxylase epsilon subunit [Alteribacillus bidgolensis]